MSGFLRSIDVREGKVQKAACVRFDVFIILGRTRLLLAFSSMARTGKAALAKSL